MADRASAAATDADEAACPPERNSQVGGVETISQEPAVFYGTDDEMDNTGSSDGGNRAGEPLADSDSEDEFESEEESVDRIDEVMEDQGTLEFELRAAEAGNVFLCIPRREEQQIDLLN